MQCSIPGEGVVRRGDGPTAGVSEDDGGLRVGVDERVEYVTRDDGRVVADLYDAIPDVADGEDLPRLVSAEGIGLEHARVGTTDGDGVRLLALL